MTLSLVERRELLAFAALMESATTSPEAQLANVAWLRVWVDAHARATPRADVEQLELVASIAIPEGSPAARPDGPDMSAAASGHVRSAAAERPRRPPSMTPDAIRKRAKRAAERAAHADADASGQPAAAVVAPGLLSRERDLSSSKSPREISHACARVAAAEPHDPERPAPEDLEVGWSIRPDLSEGIIRRSWRRFARAHPVGTALHWTNWIRREDDSLTGLVIATSAIATSSPETSSSPASCSRPIVRAPRAEDIDELAELLAARDDARSKLRDLELESATGPPGSAPAVA